MSTPVQLLVLTANRARRRRWAQDLGQSSHLQLAWSLAELMDLAGGDPRPDVVITDHLPVDGALGDRNNDLRHGEIGLITVGVEGPADVSFPDDPPSSELRLSCRLLGQLVALRRKRHRERELLESLRRLVVTDPLTSIANRRGWDLQLGPFLHGVIESQASGCLVLIDLDHFKLINDRYGHAVGDAVLRATARRLAGNLRIRDLAARLGGDEFGLLLHEVGRAEAGTIVEQLRRQVGHLDLDLTPPLQLTASAGYIVLDPAGPPDAESACRAADLALRQAKAEGRNRSIAAM